MQWEEVLCILSMYSVSRACELLGLCNSDSVNVQLAPLRGSKSDFSLRCGTRPDEFHCGYGMID